MSALTNRGWWRALAAALAAAVAVAVFTGWWEWRKLAPVELRRAAYGQEFEARGMTYEVESMEVLSPDDDRLNGEHVPEGLAVVEIKYSYRAERVQDPFSRGCQVTVADRQGVEYSKIGPRLGTGPIGEDCVPTVRRPLMPGESFKKSTTVLVPQGKAKDVSVRFRPTRFDRGYVSVG